MLSDKENGHNSVSEVVTGGGKEENTTSAVSVDKTQKITSTMEHSGTPMGSHNLAPLGVYCSPCVPRRQQSALVPVRSDSKDVMREYKSR